MLTRLQGALLRGNTQQAVHMACRSDLLQLISCRRFANDAAAADVHQSADDAGAVQADSSVQQHSSSEAGEVAGFEVQSPAFRHLQTPDPLETFRQSNISMPQLEGQVNSSAHCLHLQTQGTDALCSRTPVYPHSCPPQSGSLLLWKRLIEGGETCAGGESADHCHRPENRHTRPRVQVHAECVQARAVRGPNIR
jgi:hypothetical protein